MDVSSDDFRISQKIREDQARKKRAATKIFEETVNRVGCESFVAASKKKEEEWKNFPGNGEKNGIVGDETAPSRITAERGRSVTI